MDRRTLILGALACVAATPDPDAALFSTLDATGPLLADTFHPARVLASAGALMALAPEARDPALRRYLASRASPPEGLFAVVRMLIEVPPRSRPPSPWPGVLQPGYLRPPALGGPTPPQPADLTQFPQWPLILLEDVPLSAVAAYVLGGVPEPLAMHLDGLRGATWRTKPLNPGSAGTVRYDLVHWGAWATDRETSGRFEAQLRRYEGG